MHSQVPLSIGQRLTLVAQTIRHYRHVRRLAGEQPLPSALATIRDLPAVEPTAKVTDNPYRLASITRRVLRLVPTDTRCLMQSLTLMAHLSSRGIAAKVVIAATEGEKFGAHAWVELEGRPLLPPEAEHRRLVEL